MTGALSIRIEREATASQRASDPAHTRKTTMWRVTLLLLGLLGVASIVASPVSADDGVNHAALVVRYEDGTTQTSCVAFSESSISGEDLIRRAGLTLVADYSSSIGNAVCSINGQGCAYPADDCFCRCQGVECEYWAYYRWEGGAWQYSQLGASATQVSDGALEGWSWGPGNFSVGTVPPTVRFDDVCVAPTATPTATATSTATTTAPTSTATAAPVASGSPPEAHFEVTATSLGSGECTVLSWVTWNADTVTLNASKVMAQDRQEVCPTSSQTYTLVAVNGAGQVSREIAVVVRTQAAVATSTPATSTSLAAPTSPAVQPGAVVAAAPPPTSALPTPEPAATAEQVVQTTPAALASEEQPVAAVLAAAAKPLLAFAPAATSTPFVRRELGADGRPTPTPILVAMLSSSDQQSAADQNSPSRNTGANHMAGPAGYVAPDRSFQASLLPDYAAYLFVAALLAGSGAWVVRRRMIPLGVDRN